MRALFIILATILISCRGERWDDDLTLPKQNYTGNELQVDSYYYNYSDSHYEIYFFYRDGTTLYGSAANESELQALEYSFINGTYYQSVKNSKTDWGRFDIEGSVIKREFWPPSNGGPLEAWTHSGTIMNDSTFSMNKFWRSCKPKKTKSFEKIFHFKHFVPKPDSTNTFTN